MAGVIYEFSDWRLDCRRCELIRDGIRVRLEPKPMELLILLVEHQGQLVTRAEIARHLWSSEIFVDTEHGINTAIRKIRSILRDDRESALFVQTVAGMGYRFIAPVSIVDTLPEVDSATVAVAVPPSVIVSPQSERPAPQRTVSRTKLSLALGAVAILLLLALAVTIGPYPLAARLFHRNAAPDIASLAVIPLDNLTGDPNQQYFADGMTDELTTMLAKNSSLRVTSRTSATQFKSEHKSLGQIAQALGVDGILEGSVSRSGDQVHMTLQLIRADTDTHLWAESYDRNRNDTAGLPGEAARDIANRLHKAVSAPAAARYVNPEAHDAYLRGSYLWFRGRNEEAGQNFRRAVELQPDYALGWVGLSEYYGDGAASGEMDPVQALPQAEADARKAVELDNQLAEAHLVLGATILISQWDWPLALNEESRAIALDPKCTQAIHFRARILSILGRHEEALAAQKMATEIDPFERPWAMVAILNEARQYDAALEEARELLQAEPNLNIYYLTAVAYRGKGMQKEWAQAYERNLELSSDPASAAAFQQAFQAGGKNAALQWQLQQLERKSRSSYVSPVDLALVHAQLGDREKALALLEQGFREHSPLLLWIQSDPAYDFLHRDERYRSIIKRIGLPPQY